MKDQQPRHVFISYVRENKEQVDRLCQDLESNGVNVWLDRKSIKPGARWKDDIREAIRNGDFFIACFSKEYASRQKNFMNEELTLAIDELRQFASDRGWFIPVLLSECDVPARSIGAGETLLDINWVPLYEDWESGIQKILSVIKPIPKDVQNLIYAARSEDQFIRGRSFIELSKTGDPAAVPVLIEALKAKDRDVRSIAALALGKIGPTAMPALIEAIKNEDRDVRSSAAGALGIIGPKAESAVPVLIEALKDEDEDVRSSAATALGEIGPKAKSAVPVLIEALKDEDQLVRGETADALEQINTPEAQKALEEYKQKSK